MPFHRATVYNTIFAVADLLHFRLNNYPFVKCNVPGAFNTIYTVVRNRRERRSRSIGKCDEIDQTA